MVTVRFVTDDSGGCGTRGQAWEVAGGESAGGEVAGGESAGGVGGWGAGGGSGRPATQSRPPFSGRDRSDGPPFEGSCDTRVVERRGASNRRTPPDASPLLLVCHRIHHRPPPRPPPLVLQPRLPPTCLRTPPRVRARAHGSTLAGSGHRRRVVWYGLRAWRHDRSVRQDPRAAHQRAPRRSSPRNVVRGADPTHHRSTLHCDASTSVSHLRDRRRLQSVAVWHQRVE